MRNYQSSIAGYLLSLLLRIVNSTLRWKKYGLDVDEKHWSVGKPLIMVCWHADQLMMPWAYRSRFLNRGSKPFHALVSMHSDGRIAAKALSHLSIQSVDGSSTRGAARALLMMKEKLRIGSHIAITPDGPKGPNHVAKQGAVLLSSSSGRPLFPVVIVAQKSWIFGSWDRMFLPKPFGKAVMLAGAPFSVLPHLSRQALMQESKRLTDCLNNLKTKAEALIAV